MMTPPESMRASPTLVVQVLVSIVAIGPLRVDFVLETDGGAPAPHWPRIVLGSVPGSHPWDLTWTPRQPIGACLLSSAPRRHGLLNAPVLVLNQNYEPLNVC